MYRKKKVLGTLTMDVCNNNIYTSYIYSTISICYICITFLQLSYTEPGYKEKRKWNSHFVKVFQTHLYCLFYSDIIHKLLSEGRHFIIKYHISVYIYTQVHYIYSPVNPIFDLLWEMKRKIIIFPMSYFYFTYTAYKISDMSFGNFLQINLLRQFERTMDNENWILNCILGECDIQKRQEMTSKRLKVTRNVRKLHG